jgi:hypothetical protein
MQARHGGAKVGESQPKANLGKFSTRPYLKNKIKAQGLGVWLKWYRVLSSNTGTGGGEEVLGQGSEALPSKHSRCTP